MFPALRIRQTLCFSAGSFAGKEIREIFRSYPRRYTAVQACSLLQYGKNLRPCLTSPPSALQVVRRTISLPPAQSKCRPVPARPLFRKVRQSLKRRMNLRHISGCPNALDAHRAAPADTRSVFCKAHKKNAEHNSGLFYRSEQTAGPLSGPPLPGICGQSTNAILQQRMR